MVDVDAGDIAAPVVAAGGAFGGFSGAELVSEKATNTTEPSVVGVAIKFAVASAALIAAKSSYSAESNVIATFLLFFAGAAALAGWLDVIQSGTTGEHARSQSQFRIQRPGSYR